MGIKVIVMDASDKKLELIDWLSKLEDPSVLNKVSEIKAIFSVKSPEELKAEWENGMTMEEAKAEILKRNRDWWKK
ncbi:hypothetical protein [Flavobacterium sp. K5-23]|uniref:hypothetical protein n=1 Tax=Flavobacterium sp. K5-23 TaxID=2746225 RepID=UPI00200C9C40|nr:hypothetical protein [Flavobacterium sp. K5-23]UQD55115.1 hypothetical protein FLAK523_01405 [Flavobacterium sp. K5-23]